MTAAKLRSQGMWDGLLFKKGRARMDLGDKISSLCFTWVHRNNLVYNTCWEDPRLDRQALNLGPDDTMAVITSAGCNVLDYALLGPRAIHAVDMNPRQNSLLELKIAGIRQLEFEDFFALFGRGRCKAGPDLYRRLLRPVLSVSARGYWDRHIHCFAGAGARRSFYFHGTSGMLAWLINVYIDWVAKVRETVNALLGCRSVEEQRAHYTERLHGAFWSGFLRWTMDRDTTLSLLGVPRAQRRQVENAYPGGIAKFIEDRIEAVFTRLPLADNYFWRVYLTGCYTPQCCPEYLTREGFAQLKAGGVDCVRVHTGSLLTFLERYPGPISRFVLLDHMDWLSSHDNPVLGKEWQALVERAAPNARVLWRSGGTRVDYVDPIEVKSGGRKRRLGDLLRYHHALAHRLHQQDRVHTYGSFYIADLVQS
jgi:S-adenosylmethionine-diacylglycerol 3-amino-3-carboxypropyl transferase